MVPPARRPMHVLVVSAAEGIGFSPTRFGTMVTTAVAMDIITFG